MNTARKAVATAAVVGASLVGGALGATLLGTASAQTPAPTTSQAPAQTQAPAQAPTQAPTQDPAQAPSTDPGQAPPAGQKGPRPPRGNHDPSKGGHQANGKTEELLTGDTATKVTDAAKAAVPDGTIERVETDVDGATYEAHMVKADGSHVTVTFNADFSVAEIQTGH